MKHDTRPDMTHTPETVAYARAVLASLLDATVAYEKAQAAAAAADAVTPINTI